MNYYSHSGDYFSPRPNRTGGIGELWRGSTMELKPLVFRVLGKNETEGKREFASG